MANTEKPEIDEEEFSKLTDLWASFTVWMKWGVISVVACLALMAVALV